MDTESILTEEGQMAPGGNQIERSGRKRGAGSTGRTRRKSNGMDFLKRLLDYEIRSAKRYRRFATLVMVSSPVGRAAIPRVLRGNVRHSDELIELDSDAAIIMGETDNTSAMVAVKRFKVACGENVDLRIAMASYPADGPGAAELLSTLRRRLKVAKSMDEGAVVCSG